MKNTMTSASPSPSDHWSDYWSRGSLTSLPQDFSANYDGEVAAFWKGAFSELDDAGRMIDLCTGNGAIALLAAEYSASKKSDIEIVAVDAATISPDAIAAKYPDQAELLKRIQFISDCKVEDIDLPGASFDLVSSQYGIEYCDWGKAANQVVRLLKPGGRLVMVNHTATSDIMQFMEQEHREYSMLEKSGFFSAINGYLENSIDFNGMRTILVNLHRNLSRVLERGGTPLFRSVHSMLSGLLAMDQHKLEQGRNHLEEYYGQTRYGFDRLIDMLRVNHAIQSDDAWYRVFELAGLELVELGEIRYRGQHHAGGFLIFEKPLADGAG